MPVFDHEEFFDHEQVVFCRDAATGLNAIIAIHSTALGPALGGCRVWPFRSVDEALTDVLRLSRGMTYKAAVAGLPLGGGKAVIIADPKHQKTEAMMKAFGRHVDFLGRRYITAEDVGSTVADMDAIKTVTDHVVGVTGGAGDPSNSTAHGVFVGIQAAVSYKLQQESVEGLRVAVQGIGNVGWNLCRYLHDAGATLTVTDINQDALRRAEHTFGATVIAPNDVFAAEVDVFAPCALGAVINDRTIAQLRAPIIAGSANNVLEDEHHGAALRARGILYAPDYVINAGGLIDVARFAVGFDIDVAREKLMRIKDTLLEIFRRSDAEDQPTSEVADRLAEERFAPAP